MNPLIDKLVGEVGLTEAQAMQSIAVMKAYIKEQLPPMMSGIVDNFMQDKNAGGDTNDFMG
jgi:hypothetical protein